MIEALRERIELQKRLYAFLKLSPPDATGSRPAERCLTRPRCLGRGHPASGPEPISPRRTRHRSADTGCSASWARAGSDGSTWPTTPTSTARSPSRCRSPGDASRFLDVEAYLREARIVARLSHPNIVPVYDVGRTDDGRCYVVSKYMEGGDLKTRLGRGRPAFAESAELVAVLCDALHYTHTQDLFHRDIKPANILLDAAGVPSLADFGLALKDEDVGRGRLSRHGGLHEPRAGARRGPSGRRPVGHLQPGRRPLRAADRPPAVPGRLAPGDHAADHQCRARPPRQIDGTIPRELERICLKALAKRASERYTTARDLADDLRHFLNTVSWAAAPTSDLPPIAAVAASAPPPAPHRGRRTRARRPIKIVPKGLGSFDEHDADFFLELLPGPRDRDGLPDGLRFWKTRIEATDPDRTFRVGLIYGPSGCGKSSMVKAGLLPRLGPHVCAIYVEAAGDETEARLLRGLRRHFPALPARRRPGRGAEGPPARPRAARGPQGAAGPRPVRAVALRPARRAGERAGRRAAAMRRRARPGPLPGAGRLLDGGDAVHEGPRHRPGPRPERRRRRPLRAEARPQGAGGLRPRLRRPAAATGDLARDQDAFLDQAVAGLAQDGRVVPVRLALFAEMVKGRPWTPATLREVGGMDGVGVKFLEETFSSPRSNPNHRYHQRAAQAVLKSLLPETNADIKGRMRSIEELREVSGYADRPADFADLIRMLDSELRLITPVDPEGSVDRGCPGGRGRAAAITS